MEKLYQYLPEELVTFILVTVFSLLIGLSLRRISLKREGETTLFGTDRTFTFIGILGYLLYILDPTDYRLFMGGGAVLGLLLALNYYVKQAQFHVFGGPTIIIALITYCIAPIVATQPPWFYVMVIVTVLLFTELKHTFTELAQRMKNDEMITLAKFLAISGIILPMLPDDNLIPGINLTPYSIWLATVVVSGISYLSYLLKRYVFRESGILVSGIVGGLYSSTATISVLARKSRKVSAQEAPEYVAAMLLAVSMMFLRFLILIGIFSIGALTAIYPYLLIMSAVAAGTAWFLHSRWKRQGSAYFCRAFCGIYNRYPLYVDIRRRGRVDSALLCFRLQRHHSVHLESSAGYGQCACFIDNGLQHAGDSKQHCREYVLCIVLLRQEESVAFVGVERFRLCHCRQCVPAAVFLLSVNQCAFRFF